MAVQIKRCQCGAVIASMPGSNWYRWIRAKYCPDCAKAAKREQNRQSESRRRKERKAEKVAKRSRVQAEREAEEAAFELAALRRQEAVLLKQRIERMGGSTAWMRTTR